MSSVDKSNSVDMANLNRVVRIWAHDTNQPYPENFVEAFPEALAWFLSNSETEILKMPNIGRKTLAWARQKSRKDTP